MRQGRKAEVKMGLNYAIEGLDVCTNSKEKDSWLDLFKVVFEELEEYDDVHRNSMFDLDSKYLNELEDLANLAEQVKNTNVGGRQEIIEENDMVSRAEEIYNQI